MKVSWHEWVRVRKGTPLIWDFSYLFPSLHPSVYIAKKIWRRNHLPTYCLTNLLFHLSFLITAPSRGHHSLLLFVHCFHCYVLKAIRNLRKPEPVKKIPRQYWCIYSKWIRIIDYQSHKWWRCPLDLWMIQEKKLTREFFFSPSYWSSFFVI